MTRELTLFLRLEGMAAAIVAVGLFWAVGGPWLLFALLFLAPDLFMLGYAAGPLTGARIYNLAHTYVGPLAMAGAWLLLDAPTLLWVALAWAAHIGFDRALGYGLKRPTGFKDTHLSGT